MDLGTLIGIILGIGLVVGSIVVGGGAGFLNLPSLMITIGGAFAATLMNFPLPKIIGTISVVRKAFASQDKDYLAVFKRLSDFAVRARRDGILGLESEVENLEDVFMQKGLRMAVDGNSAEVIEAVLEQDIASMVERHQIGHGIFQAVGNYAPAFGMIGTLIGLIQMLRNLDDPSSIGMGMSVALLTTLYGSLSERRRDLAILRALGAHRRTIFGLLLLEAATLSLLGVLGAFGTHALIHTLAGSVIRAQTGMVLDPLAAGLDLLGIAALMILLGIAAGLLPAAKAYRADVASHLTPLT